MGSLFEKKKKKKKDWLIFLHVIYVNCIDK